MADSAVFHSGSNAIRQTPTVPDQFAGVAEILERGVTDEVFPGAVLLVGRNGQVLFEQSVGTRWLQRSGDEVTHPTNRMALDTVFDIASLTGVLVTTTILMHLVEAHRVRLEDRVTRYLQSFGVHGKSKITLGDVLSHAAGFAPWIPFYEELVRRHAGPRLGILTSRGARTYVFAEIDRLELRHAPGTKQLYSDIGFLLLGRLIEEVTGSSVDRVAQKLIFQPLGLKSTSYVDLAMIKRRGIHPVTDRIAPTEECPWRKRVLCGEVQDDNAWAMGGIAGNAGVFSSARDLHRLVSELMAAHAGRSNYISREVVRRFLRGPIDIGEQSFAYGWDLPNRENGMSDSVLSPAARGHCGFTGCSVWIEPEQGIDVILMTNRVHPTRNNKRIRAYRPELHAAVMAAATATNS